LQRHQKSGAKNQHGELQFLLHRSRPLLRSVLEILNLNDAVTLASHVLLQSLCASAKSSSLEDMSAVPLVPFEIGDPWLLASCLQKAIRRDEPLLARRAAQQLLRLDPQRLWRRILTIALEDIGIGDIAVAAQLVGLSGLPQARRLFGGAERALDFAVLQACSAVKDRTADHFSSVARRRPRSASDTATAQRVLGATGIPWHQRLGAVLSLSMGDGARQRAETFDFVGETFRAAGAPELLLCTCQIYARRSRDSLGAFVLLAWALQQPQIGTVIVSSGVPATTDIGGWPAYVFDPIRTRSGRRAVDLWLRSYLQRPLFDAGQVAAALWNWESAACRHQLHWPLGDLIAQEAHCADLLERDLALSRHSDIHDWVVAEQSVLSCARSAVWQGLLRHNVLPASEPDLANAVWSGSII
jgi:hypothetical protein